MLAVCSSSTSEFAVALDTIKGVLGITGSTEDLYLEGAIRKATSAAEGYLGYPLGLQTYQETVSAYGNQGLMLSRTPVVGVIRLLDDTSTGTAKSYASTDFRVEDADAGLLTLTTNDEWDWTATWGTSVGGGSYPAPRSELRSWLVEYRAGYTLAGSSSTECGFTSTGRTLPYDIEEAVQDTVVSWFRAKGRDPMIIERSVGDLTVRYSDLSRGSISGALPGGLTDRAKALLNPYRRMV